MVRRAEKSDSIQQASIPTKDGVFTAYFSSRGLAKLEFPVEVGLAPLLGSTYELALDQSRWLELTRSALERVLEARAPLRLPPLDLSSGTAFQRSVWEAMREIPPGKTKSYGDVARAIGRPKAVRAVGQACGANPIPLFVPCHRVVAAGGRLGGFSGGLPLKRKLLEREGVRFSQ